MAVPITQERLEGARSDLAKAEKLKASYANRGDVSLEERQRVEDQIRGAHNVINEINRGFEARAAEAEKARYEAERLKGDIGSGMSLAEQYIKPGAAGRVGEERSADVADILARRREALGGLSSKEQMAQRDIAKQQIDRQTETARRRLASIQASTGLRGGVAAAQQASVLQEGMMQRSQFEKELFLENERLKRDALSAFESSVTAVEAEERSRKLFNIQQQNREQAGRLQFATSFASILSGERSADRAAAAQAAAASAQSGGGK